MSFVEPTYSKSRVNRAGASVRAGAADEADWEIVNTWRAAHSYLLNTFQANLRRRSRGTDIVVAQRLKRLPTIEHKLSRYPSMQLARMHDIAGCRLIFSSIDQLREFRADFHKGRFEHRLRHEVDEYDYIANPKTDGYRGVHDVYEYRVNSISGQKWNGLQLELQYRTLYQHAWATSVEVVGLVTHSQPKFHVGDPRHSEFFALASEIIARVFENRTSCRPSYSARELVARFNLIESEIHLLATLDGINSVNTEVLEGKNVILHFKDEGHLEITSYTNQQRALEEYFRLEKSVKGGAQDVVLVSAQSGADIRVAFRNYFSDTSEFVRLVEAGRITLLEQL